MLARPFYAMPMAGLVILWVAPGRAHATGAGEKQVAAGLGFALAGDGDTARSGMQAGVEAAIGLTDTWAARGAVSLSWQPGHASDGPRELTTVDLGATYSLDVVRWVPFLDLGLSLADLRGGRDSAQRLGPQVGLGAEYLLSRRWTLAAFARFDYLAVRLAGPGGSQPWLACAGLRLGWMF